MAKIYCIKSKKEIPKDSPRLKEKRNQGFYSLKMRDYILKVIFECPKGHLFSEEYHADKIEEYGLIECLNNSLVVNENILCPECTKNI